MKFLRSPRYYGCLAWLLCSSAAFAQPAAGPAEIHTLITQAATYDSGQNKAPLRQIEELVRQSITNPALRETLETGLAQLLAANSTFEARLFACQQLAVIGSDQSLPVLAGLLKNDQTVGMACLAIGTRASTKANAILRDSLASSTGAARVQIINALGDRQDAKAVRPLLKLIQDSEPAAAAAAIVALGKIANRPARRAIEALLREGNPVHASAVVEALQHIAASLLESGDRKAAAEIYQDLLEPAQPDSVRRGALAALVRLDKDGGEQRILEVLQGRDAVLKPVAITSVRSLPAPQASEKFGGLMPTLEPRERVWMIEALAARGDEAARSAIASRLQDDNTEVRLTAIAASSILGDASTVPLFSRALANVKGPEEKLAIEEALGNLSGGDKTDQAIIEELNSASAGTKIGLISALGRRGSRIAVPSLLRETGEADPAIAKTAFEAMSELATVEDLPALLDRLINLKTAEARGDAEDAVARALMKVENVSTRANALCASLSETADVDTQCSLIRLLPNCPDAKALDALKTACSSTESPLRDTAIRSLAEWPDATAWNPLAEIFRQPENEAYRVLALRALVRIAGEENAHPDAGLIEHYRQLFAGARSDDDRKLVLGALAGVSHPDALQLALTQLANPGARAEAELAVKKIAEAVKAQHPQAAQEALESLKKTKP